MFDLTAVQKSLAEFGLDGWLLYDFRGSNVLARRVLGLDQRPAGTRRFFYFIPATGIPRKLVHRIETAALDDLPGEKTVYLPWQELEAGVAAMIEGCRRIAMEYAPRVSNPYVSKVDAGVLELVRATGVDVVSSGDLIQRFESTWDDDQWRMHREAEVFTTAAFDLAFGLIADRVRGGGTIRETEVQSAIMDHFHRNGLTTYSPPIIGAGPHSGDPHYEPVVGRDGVIGAGDFVLIDLWAKLDRPRSVYSDLTRVGYVGTTVPSNYAKIFAIVAAGAGRGDPMCPGCVRLRPAARGLGGRRGLPLGDRRRRIRRVLHPPHRAQHRPGSPRQRRSTWTTSRLTRSGWSCAGPASRSSRGSTSKTSGSAAR